MKKVIRKILSVLLVFGIIAAGVVCYQLLARAKEPPPRVDEQKRATVVEVTEALASTGHVKISAMGTVMPSRRVTLYPEVNGRVVFCNDKLVPGGRFRVGETALRIDPKQYELLVEQQRATVARSAMELALEEGRKAVAEREWHLIDNEVKPTDAGKKLALRETQLEVAKSTLAAAKSNLEIAKMNRRRTAIKAPFNALVTEKFVDIGQIVGPSSRLATLVDADVFWVGVSIPVHQLPWITFPKGKRRPGSKVVVKQEMGAGVVESYGGRVFKLLGGVDPQGKMARLVIEVENPFEPIASSGRPQIGKADDSAEPFSFPLLLDAAVTVEIEGPKLDGMIEIPRHAVRMNDKVWLLTDDRKLRVSDVEVLWSSELNAYVRGGIEAGDKVITNRIETPVAGMALRLEGENVNADAGVAKEAEPSPETVAEKSQ